MIKAVIFDLDGVLVDAVDWHYQALNRALSLFGFHIPADEHNLIYNGLPSLAKLDVLSRRKGFPRSLHNFTNEMKQHYTREILQSQCHPEKNIIHLLDQLKKSGLRLALASNSIRNTVDIILDRMNIRDYFDVTLSNEEVAKPKPSPEMYFKAMNLLGLEPDQCLIIEDSAPGVQAAQQASPHLIVVNSPFEVTPELIRHAIEAKNRQIELTSQQPANSLFQETLEIVIPMAGMGSRFAQAGYHDPKPFIPIEGKPMIQWVIENLRPKVIQARFTFLCNEKHLQDYPVANLLNSLAPGCQIVRVPTTTQGAACTALLASDAVASQRPLLIANSDQWVEFSVDDFLYRAIHNKCDGSILTFSATDAKWSYARLNANGHVAEVAEKRAISEHATVGIYYYRHAKDFFDGAKSMIRENLRVNNEFYVCPVYNELIRQNKSILIHEIKAEEMHGLGTPEDLSEFFKFRNIKSTDCSQNVPS